MANDIWTVVLAGGSGRRLAAVTGDVPKQFWRLQDHQSLLESTLDRFAAVSSPSRTVVVVDHSHRVHLTDVPGRLPRASVVFQPRDRGTATGLLLGLTAVLDDDPNALVVITPADHGVIDADAFRKGLVDAAARIDSTAGVILFGVLPTGANEDYGWITTERQRIGLCRVSSFVEKPPGHVARQLLRDGAAWNTMVLLARAQQLRSLAARFLPDLTKTFDGALQVPTDEREAYLRVAYQQLNSFDLSRDLLSRARDLWTYVWPTSIGWSDLGTPERLGNWQSTTAIATFSAA